ncbi:MAG: hypothetical protein QOF77_1892 [Solirubrobacteraceae bacterium]|jgi:opacity protein-like surface antigen|nr:hypothetical protein [Solirubrobacteraceae bacterium]
MPKLLAAAALLLLPAPAALGAAAAKPKPAPAAPKAPPVVKSRHLWATVDVCNPPSLPRVIGIRGSMPGTGLKNEQMFMRFQVEYQSGVDWKLIPGADSGYRTVGSAVYKARQSGQQFTIPAKVPYVLRGMVSFQWRRRGHAVLKADRITTAGHIALAGAEPPGYSAAACALP